MPRSIHWECFKSWLLSDLVSKIKINIEQINEHRTQTGLIFQKFHFTLMQYSLNILQENIGALLSYSGTSYYISLANFNFLVPKLRKQSIYEWGNNTKGWKTTLEALINLNKLKLCCLSGADDYFYPVLDCTQDSFFSTHWNYYRQGAKRIGWGKTARLFAVHYICGLWRVQLFI